MRDLARPLLLALGLTLVSSMGAMAQPPAQEGQEEPENSRAAQFRAVQGADAEEVPGGTLMVAAYGVMWFFVAAYVGRLGLLRDRNTRRLMELEKAMGEAPRD